MKTLTKKTFNGPREVDFSAILVVYKSIEGFWKGFAHSYDVTTQATTLERTLNQLRNLVEDYESILKKYDYPEHLVHKPLTDQEDRQKFNEVMEHLIANKITEEYSKNTPFFYVETVKL